MTASPLRVGLIRPPIIQLPSSLSSFGAVPPIGLAYVAAALEREGHEVYVIDAAGEALSTTRDVPGPKRLGDLELQGLMPAEIIDRLAPDTQVVGITHMFLHEWPIIQELAALIRARLPDAVIVFGGENASSFWEWVFKLCPEVDYIVQNEGEFTMVELADCIRDGRDATHVAGLAWRDGAEGRCSDRRGRVLALDSIPRPAWHLFPIENYMAHADTHGVNRGRAMPILATRGCPFQCTFCSSPQMWTTRYVTREPTDVVDEIEDYIRAYGVQNINFCDLTAIIKRKWILEFCDLIAARGLEFTWQLPSGTRSEVLDAEVLGRMYTAGARNITYNPETGSDALQKAFKKRVKLEKMLTSLRAANEVGMVTRTCYIVGHPEERRRDLIATARYLVTTALAGVDDASVMVFGPFPGSEDFERLVAEDRILVDENYFYLALVRSGRSLQTFHPTHSTSEIVATQMGLMFLFYGVAYLTHPHRFVDRARALWNGQESNAVDQLLRVKLRQLTSRTNRFRFLNT